MSDLQTPDSKARSDKTSKRLRWALAASLAVNLAVAGMVIGARFHNDGPRGGFARELNFGAFTEALSHEDRDKLRAAVMAKAPDMPAARRQKREDMAAELSAPPPPPPLQTKWRGNQRFRPKTGVGPASRNWAKACWANFCCK